MDRSGQPRPSGEHRAFGPHDRQRQESTVVTPHPGQQTGPQERRFTGPRRTQHHEEARDTGSPHTAKCVEAEHDFRVAPEEHRRVDFGQRFPAAVGRSVGIVLRRPSERIRADAGPSNTFQQSVEAVRAKHHRRQPVAHVDRRRRSGSEQVAALPLRGQLVAGRGLQAGTEQSFVQFGRSVVLTPTFLGCRPVLRQQADHRFAATIGRLQCLPPLDTGRDTGVGVDVEEDIGRQRLVLLGQPLFECDGFSGVHVGMAQEYARHLRPSPSALPRSDRHRRSPGRYRCRRR